MTRTDIISLRKQLLLTKKEFAESVNSTEKIIHYTETGKSKISKKLMAEINNKYSNVLNKEA